MVSARQLYDLQQIELQIHRRQQSLKSIEAKLQDTKAFVDAQVSLTNALKALDKARADLKDAELAGQQLAKKIKDTEQQMYSGRTTNAKELVNLQSDLKMLQRHAQEGESQTIDCMAKVEKWEQAAKVAQANAQSIEQSTVQHKQELKAEEHRLKGELEALEKDVAQARGGVDAQALGLYQTIKTARGGMAVSAVDRGMCKGCGLQLPSQVLQRARLSKELVRCTSCGRILYVT